MVGYLIRGNEHSLTMKEGKILAQISEYQLLKKDTVLWISLTFCEVLLNHNHLLTRKDNA